MRLALSSAVFWYVLTAVIGALLLSAGVAVEYGYGHGLIVLGAASIFGSQVIRQGMTSVA